MDLSSHRGVSIGMRNHSEMYKVLDREIDKIYSELSALRKENNSLEDKISALSDENQKLKTEFLFRLENLQSEIRTLSTGVEEYKDYLKRPSKEIGRVKEDVEVRLKVLEEKRKNLEEKNRAQEEKIKRNGGPSQRCGREDKTGGVGKIESSQRGSFRTQRALGSDGGSL